MEAPLRKEAKKFTPPVYLITYADGPEIYHKNQNMLAASALNKGFDFILNYNRHHLDPKFYQQNKQILDQKKGSGYWLWKPWIILDVMQKAPPGAILFYVDTGFTFIKPVTDLIAHVQKHERLFVYYDGFHDWVHGFNCAGKFTQRETLIRMGCDTKKCIEGISLAGGFMGLKNTKENQNFIKKWLQYSQNKNILCDTPHAKEHHKVFLRHHHDQAVLNVLYNKTPPKEKYLLWWDRLVSEYVNWHHRSEDKHTDYSLLPKLLRNKLTGIERYFLNATPIRYIRKKF